MLFLEQQLHGAFLFYHATDGCVKPSVTHGAAFVASENVRKVQSTGRDPEAFGLGEVVVFCSRLIIHFFCHRHVDTLFCVFASFKAMYGGLIVKTDTT